MAYTYRFIDKYGNVIYIGKTVNMDLRMQSHFNKGHLPRECYNAVCRIEYQKHKTESDALIMETYYITKYSPKYNKLGQSKDMPTIKFDEGNWKVYQVLKQPKKNTKKANWGCLTWITILALFYAIYQVITMM
jgi:excinuclease UvrABC nuclease subunit